jgi:predicted PolB exonuclease-like 3'-5' exonuclease
MTNPETILFLDIETVPAYRSLSEVPEELRELWIEAKSKKKKKKDSEAEGEEEAGEGGKEYKYDLAGLSGEFGKIVCISLGHFEGGIADQQLKVFSLASHDEKEILLNFIEVLTKFSSYQLCAHNGKGFDFPFLAKRILIHGLPLPAQLDSMGKKPWEIPHLDTNEMWAFGAKGANTGAKLKLLCALFGIPSPKDDIDGSQVRGVYYDDNDLPRIVKYCEKDIVSLARVFKKLRGYSL